MADQGRVVIRNASILDPAAGELLPDRVITVEGGDIVDVGDSPGASTGARQIDAGGRVVMPGLIDGHVHVLAYTANLPAAAEQSP
jgi:imidazolonepropionase-like amidohydrolase